MNNFQYFRTLFRCLGSIVAFFTVLGASPPTRVGVVQVFLPRILRTLGPMVCPIITPKSSSLPVDFPQKPHDPTFSRLHTRLGAVAIFLQVVNTDLKYAKQGQLRQLTISVVYYFTAPVVKVLKLYLPLGAVQRWFGVVFPCRDQRGMLGQVFRASRHLLIFGQGFQTLKLVWWHFKIIFILLFPVWVLDVLGLLSYPSHATKEEFITL